MRTRLILGLTAALLAAGAAACSSSSSPTVSAPGPTTATTANPTTTGPAASTPPGVTPPTGGAVTGGTATVTLGGCKITVSTDLTRKPTVSVPSTAACKAAPSKLEIGDVVVGSGPAAAPSDAVNVRYVGLNWAGLQEFDASWDNGLVNGFMVSPLGSANVIAGWNQGLIGAKGGGRRVLVIPPSLGYGPEGSAPVIGPNETLIFVVDVTNVTN